jgi:DNA polymerase III subunit alpha
MIEKPKEQTKDEFVHLHCHDEYSTLDGINRVDKLPSIAKEMGFPALAQTNHGNLAGSYQFYKECNKAGIKPILGLEAYYTIQDHTIREPDAMGERYYHLVLLAQNNAGWKNLMALSSRAYTEGMYFKPRLSDSLLSQYSEGIIATTACLGSAFSKLLLLNRRDEAERLIDGHCDIFTDRFFIELQLHEDEEQQALNKALMEIAAKKNLPLILTNDAHYTHQEHKSLHEQALCMQTNNTMYNPKRFTFGNIDVHVGSAEWMSARASSQGIPQEALTNTIHIANMIDDKSYFTNIINHYPSYPLPIEEPSWEHLKILSKKGLTTRFGGIPPIEYRERLLIELKAIKKMGFSDYILIVSRFINYAREELDVIPGPGRGSAAGSWEFSLLCTWYHSSRSY